MTDFSQELTKDFLEEAFDLLDNLEKSLLVLEKNPSDDKAIQEVFRAAHTIKGGAGTVGFSEILNLTHIMEDVLDLARKKKLSFQSADISVLLECRDQLEKMLNSREKGEAFTGGRQEVLLQSLSAMKKQVSEPVPVQQKPAVQKVPETAAKISGFGRNLLEQVMDRVVLSSTDMSMIIEDLNRGDNVFLIRYNMNENYEMKDVSSFQIYALLNDVSDIIKIHPPLLDLEKEFYQEVVFIVSSSNDEGYIRDKTNLRDMIRWAKIYQVTQNTLKDLELVNQYTSGQTDIKDLQPAGNKAAAMEPLEPASGSPEPAPEHSIQTPSAAEEAKKPEPARTVEQGDIQKRNVATLRVESWKIDELLNLLGELVITKATFSQLNVQFDQIGQDVKTSLKEFIGGIAKLQLSPEEGASKEKNQMLLNAMNLLFSSIDLYTETIQKLNRISSSLQENVMAMRMVPIQMVFSRFPRLIRDMADKLDKKIDLVVEGVETEIDKGMVDDIFDPLIHILRNAVDHGIDLPKERLAAGKPETGRIVLKAVHEGENITIEVTDDGKGIDVEAIKRKAIEGGFISKDVADRLSQKELLGLIFLPGLSTAKKVTDLSGRGVGMDVVKKKIEEIGGSVGVATARGKGSRFVIRLPLTLAIIQGLLVVVKDMHYILPVASIEETVIIGLKDLKEINGRMTLELREKFIPVLSLKKYFYHDEIIMEEDAKEYCIIAKFSDSFIGIIVSEVIGEQDIVIKPLNTKLIKSPGISAATIIGNGEIGYIIDTTQIINQYFKKQTA